MAACKACEDPLVLQVHNDDDDDDETGQSSTGDTVPDDLELRCGCHFHWQCLLDEASMVALSLKCPSCDAFLPANEAGPSTTNTFLTTTPGSAILARYTNEGGVQDVDLLPTITEEAYLESNPEARPARAMHVMCSEGDVEGIVALLQDASSEGADVGGLIRYQDPLSGMKSGIHLALERNQVEVVWLLLWISSTLPDQAFPEEAQQVAQSLGITDRLHVNSEDDIRSLKDGQGLAAVDLAKQLRGPWQLLLDADILT